MHKVVSEIPLIILLFDLLVPRVFWVKIDHTLKSTIAYFQYHTLVFLQLFIHSLDLGALDLGDQLITVVGAPLGGDELVEGVTRDDGDDAGREIVEIFLHDKDIVILLDLSYLNLIGASSIQCSLFSQGHPPPPRRVRVAPQLQHLQPSLELQAFRQHSFHHSV